MSPSARFTYCLKNSRDSDSTTAIDQTVNQFSGLGMYKAMRTAEHLMLPRQQISLTVRVPSVLFKELKRSVSQKDV